MNTIEFTQYDLGSMKSDILKKISRFESCGNARFSTIYGVPRGGTYPATVINEWIHTHGMNNQSRKPRQIFSRDEINESTLIIDDIIDSGRTRERFKDNFFLSLFVKDTILPYEADKTDAVKVVGNNEWIQFFWEKESYEDEAEDLITRQLEMIGEDVSRNGLIETPSRVVRSWKELYSGYSQNPEELIKTFETDSPHDEMIVLKDIQVYSMCEHHMLPFVGKANIAYIPNGSIIGISKIARIVDAYARRLQVQERLTYQIASCLMAGLNALGVACVIEAEHYCMRMRGCREQDSRMVTSAVLGVMKNNPAARQEFLSLISMK